MLDVDLLQLQVVVEHIDEVFIRVEADLILVFIEVGQRVVLRHLRKINCDYLSQLTEGLPLVLDYLVLALVD